MNKVKQIEREIADIKERMFFHMNDEDFIYDCECDLEVLEEELKNLKGQ